MCIKMSDVRLSNASPTVERVDARQPDNPRPSVRRSLFGSPDREELREVVEASRQEEVHRFRVTYNFDPVEDRPLSPGNFQWEEDNNAPEFYRRPPHERLRGDGSQRDQPETTEGQTTATERSRKRPRDSSDSCCSEPLNKSSRTNGDNKDDEPDDGTSQAAQVSEEAPEDQ